MSVVVKMSTVADGQGKHFYIKQYNDCKDVWNNKFRIRNMQKYVDVHEKFQNY